MSTDKQKEAGRRNIERAREIESERLHGKDIPYLHGLTTAEEDRLPAEEFAFPQERKEPLVDASHVRNAVARFDQVVVIDHERAQAWRRIQAAAKRLGVRVRANNWRQLFVEGHERRK